MHRLLVLSSLFFCVTNAGLVRLPKIYNALITSDENLSPSQAYPILEPVLRTTALGVAFPPIVVHPQIRNHEQQPPNSHKIEDADFINNKKEETTTQSIELSEELENTNKEKTKPQPKPQLAYHGSLYPLAYDPYVPYGYHHDFLYPALPFYQQPVFVDLGHYENNRKTEKEEPLLKPAIHIKKNPDIPDVLPPLPIRNERKRKS